MDKILEKDMGQLIGEGCGMFSDFGYFPGTNGKVIIEGKAGIFLASVDSDFENFQRDGVSWVKPRPRLLLAIGGLPLTETEKLAKELGISVRCADDVVYLRSRSRWTEKLEKELISVHAKGIRPNMNEFGCTAEIGASLYWKSMQASKRK